MSRYRAPIRDMLFVLRDLAPFEQLAALPGCEELPDVLDAVLDEAAAFAGGVLEPLNRSGDTDGCTFVDGTVQTPPGFAKAYQKFAQAGWIGLAVPSEYGGQGLPQILLGPTLEMWNAANIGFANGPLLNQGAIEAIELVGSDEQKHTWLPHLVSGRWTGTMCLTEPQAGSDLAQVRTRAVPDGDAYRLTGQKIFITFGEHDMAENIVHLVLARLPGAPEGTKGISLFIVPKFVVDSDGKLGEANEVVCTGIEHKLGINGNPTCTMSIGEGGRGSLGYLVGEANRGLEYMFVMMNAARFSVGVQAIGLADRAYQHSLEYARERVQGRALEPASPKGAVTIVHHPDVRRMLMWQKATIEAMRALSYVTAASIDFSQRHPDERVRKEHRAFVEFMTPIVKGWCTESAVDLCSTALQVFGGMGYVEETGIAQFYRDVRITTIYEGTTGIQSLDLIGRKLVRDMGATATAIGKRIAQTASECAASANDDVRAIGAELSEGLKAVDDASQWIGMTALGDFNIASACSVPYLKLWGVVAAGWQMARAASLAADRLDSADPAEREFYVAKLGTAAFYARHVLSQARWYARQVIDGSNDVLRLDDRQLDADRPARTG
ncbi:MAG TPA: acyl-CoA dehydrogenase [Candidatus Tumulicola sp.]